MCRSELDHVHPIFLEHVQNGQVPFPRGLPIDDHGPTARQRNEDRRHGEIEAERRKEREVRGPFVDEGVPGPADVIGEAAVVDHHALRVAGGA